MENKSFTYRPNWENDGMLELHNAQTLATYQQLRYESHPKGENLGFFFAFSAEQFHQGYAMLVKRGFIKDGEKVVSAGCGCYGTREGIEKMNSFYEDNERRIAELCNPAEVYAFENNNHESCINYEGDSEAWKIVCAIFGKERASGIRRYYKCD